MSKDPTLHAHWHQEAPESLPHTHTPLLPPPLTGQAAHNCRSPHGPVSSPFICCQAGVSESFHADENPLKINLGVGAYRCGFPAEQRPAVQQALAATASQQQRERQSALMTTARLPDVHSI